jgi:hypothetical protein
MLAIAVAGVVLALEPVFFHYAVNLVRSGESDYIWSEAVTVWLIMNVGLTLLVGGTVRIVREVAEERAADR